jgi:hypothetical protein
MDERERRLRRVFGPPVPAPGGPGAPSGSPARRPRRRASPRLLAAAGAVVLLAAALVAFWTLTPHDHTAPCCFWWTATRVGDVSPGSHGCVRGYVRGASGLAEGPAPDDYRLSYALNPPDTTSTRPPCPFRPGNAVVIRYHAVYDDGRTLLVVDDCR